MNELGDLQTGQLITLSALARLLDLPTRLALILGLDWGTRYCTEISRRRTPARGNPAPIPVRSWLYLRRWFSMTLTLALQLRQWACRFAPCSLGQWLRCPVADTLATAESGVFQLVPSVLGRTGRLCAWRLCPRQRGPPPLCRSASCRRRRIGGPFDRLSVEWSYVHRSRWCPCKSQPRLTLPRIRCSGRCFGRYQRKMLRMWKIDRRMCGRF